MKSKQTVVMFALFALFALLAETAQAQGQGRRAWGVGAMAAGAVLLAFSSHDVCMTSGERTHSYNISSGFSSATVSLEHIFDATTCTSDMIRVSNSRTGQITASRAELRSNYERLQRINPANRWYEEIAFVDGFTAETESETRPVFLYGGIGAIAAGGLAAFWPQAPVDVRSDIRNNGVRVSKTFKW